MARKKTPWGVSPSQEAWVQLPAGLAMAFESAEKNPAGTSYVRFLDKNGGEVGYWISDEWREAPEEVMGAICGLMLTYQETDEPEKFYQFGPDAKFPPSVKFADYG